MTKFIVKVWFKGDDQFREVYSSPFLDYAENVLNAYIQGSVLDSFEIHKVVDTVVKRGAVCEK